MSQEPSTLNLDLHSVVHLAYEVFLGRKPESDEIVDEHDACGSATTIIRSIKDSAEGRAR